MGKCQGQNRRGDERNPRGSRLTWPRAPWCRGASSSAQRLSHDARRTTGLCGWPPCGRRLQWKAASPPGPFPPKFLLWSLFSHLRKWTTAKSPALHGPRLGPALPALVLGEPALTVPAATQAGPCPTQRGSLGWAQPQGSSQAPAPGRAAGTGMAQGPWQGGRGHCRPWASPHGHQWDRAALVGSRPEPQRRDTRCDTTDSAVVSEAWDGMPIKHLRGRCPSLTDTIYTRCLDHTNHLYTQCSSGHL